LQFFSHQPTRICMQHGIEHLVLGQEGLHQDSATIGSTANKPRCSRQQAERFFGGAIPRRKQLGVEVDKRDRVCAANAVQRCLSSDVHASVRHRLGVGGFGVDSHHWPTRSSLEFFA
jgi:hypothetical protein